MPVAEADIAQSNRLSIRKGASVATDPIQAAAELFDQIGQPNTSLALFYCAPTYDLEALGAALASHFEGVQLIGCTSAGEITPSGYLNGSLTGMTIASDDFVAVTQRVDNLTDFVITEGERVATEALATLSESGTTDSSNTFGFLLIDGMSRREELVVSSIYPSLFGVQLFGGSAGDDLEFGKTHVYHDGEFHTDAALLTLVRTSRPFTVFRTQHFEGGSQKMVVTAADVAERTVTEINGVPAGREYARMVGLEVEQLDPMIFAAHPVVVRVGGEEFVRSILQVNEDESLTFACAIDEGVVLTVAEGVDMVSNLSSAFETVRKKIGQPEIVFGCDCLFRAIEMDQKGLREQISEIMVANNVIGIATYGEQFNAMHVNQTFTGVAIGPAATRDT